LSEDAQLHPISTTLGEAIRKRRAVAVLGYGISNRPLVALLLDLGACVVVYDQKDVHELGEDAALAVARGAAFCSTHEAWVAKQPALIFRSPGLRPDLSPIGEAVMSGALLASEMQWFMERTPATVIAITGSDGKSTTTTLTAKILEAQCVSDGQGQVFLGGNIGAPLLPLLPKMTARDFAVVELSSFQLATPMRPPARAAITNVTPNHLNWHTDMDEYIAAKRNICDARCGTVLVANVANDITSQLAKDYTAQDGEVMLFGVDSAAFPSWARQRACCLDGTVSLCQKEGEPTSIMAARELRLPGRHNLENFLTACALTCPYATPEAMAAVGGTFGGVEHRLERVRELRGVTYYNSSIDSSPTRTAAALSALPERSCVTICGGYDKNIPYAPLAQALCERAGAVVLTGATREKIMAALRDCPTYDANALRVEICPNFEEAVQRAATLAEDGYGENVLLSPACASFDAFVNFEARGCAFREQVMAMK
jgi:UDP-N-acetylmuramoylalanine--D-glutamate ligase